MPVLKQVCSCVCVVPPKVWCFNMDFFRMLLAMAALVSLAYASEKVTNAVPPNGQPFWPLGMDTGWAINHVGMDSTQ